MTLPLPAASTTPPAPTVLSTLLRFRTLQQTRTALSHQLDDALSTYLVSPTSILSPPAPTPTPAAPQSTCASEASAAPSQAELGEVLRIGFEGLMQVRGEMLELAERLSGVLGRGDLGRVVGRVEELEGERLKATIERDQARRLGVLGVGGEFQAQVTELEAK